MALEQRHKCNIFIKIIFAVLHSIVMTKVKDCPDLFCDFCLHYIKNVVVQLCSLPNDFKYLNRHIKNSEQNKWLGCYRNN